MSKPKQTRWFKSGRVDFTGTEKIDAENGILYGVIMCQVGEAKGHDVHLEQEFIDAGISYAQKHHGKKGMKARFGHPSMSNETLGTEMGRFKEFRVEDDKMVADLHLFESANLSPTNPGMRDWMLSQAKEDPEAIMCSIVFQPDYYYQYDDEGKKIKVWQYDKDGNWVSANSKMKVYVTLKELMFCDIVDQGAATDKLFSEELNSDKFAVIATKFFNEYPQIDEFIQENPDKILSFLQQRFGIDQDPEPGILEKFISLFKPKQSNQLQFYMSKVQLSKLAALAEKLAKNEAGPEDYAAVQTELQEQGLNVVVLGQANHETLLKKSKALQSSVVDAMKQLSPEITEEQLAETSLSDLITKKLTELSDKDKEIAELKKQLGETSDPPPTPPSGEQQDFGEGEGDKEFESSVDRELAAYQSKLNK